MATMTTAHAAPRGWIPDTSTFASRLASIRNAKGWNVKEAADTAGLPVQSWRNWEEGKRPRNMPEVVAQLSRSLGVDRDWLMWGEPIGATTGRWSPLVYGVSPRVLVGSAA